MCQVFKKAYIPRTLNDVSHYERDVDAMAKEQENKQNDNVLYQTVTGMKKDLSGVQTVPSLLEGCAEDRSSSSDEDEELDDEDEHESEEDDTQEHSDQNQAQPMDKKEKKKLVKEAQREKRKNKVPKHVKKRKEKVAKMKKGR
ncbi:serine/threonine-protein kinase RIO1 [Tachysurus ichikawai]